MIAVHTVLFHIRNYYPVKDPKASFILDGWTSKDLMPHFQLDNAILQPSKLKVYFKRQSPMKTYENQIKGHFEIASNYNNPQIPWKRHTLTKDFQNYFKSIKIRHRLIFLKNKWNIQYYKL